MADGWVSWLGVKLLRWLFGIGAVVLPALLGACGVLMIVLRDRANLRAFWRGLSVAFLVLLTGVHLAVPRGGEFETNSILFSHGGLVGGGLAWLLRAGLGEAGAVIALVAFGLVALLFFTETSLSQTTERMGEAAGQVAVFITGHNKRRRARKEQSEDEYSRTEQYSDDDEEWDTSDSLPAQIVAEESQEEPPRRRRVQPIIEREKSSRPSPFMEVNDVDVEPPQFRARNGSSPSKAEASEKEEDEAPRVEILNAPLPRSVVDTPLHTISPDGENVPINAPDQIVTPQEALEAQALAVAEGGENAPSSPAKPRKARRSFGNGILMPEYFDDVVRAYDPPMELDLDGVEDDIQKGVKGVTETLQAFKIDARVTDVKRGPVITRYEVRPAPGVRVNSIANLDRDLARALSAIAVRIEAPVPGKSVVGIEVPNKKVHLVRLRDVLETDEFLAAPSKLSFVLGKDIAGQTKWADLTKMPHLLIAGATNSGKSVCLNSIIASILTRATPDEVRFSLIDPKRVELTLYNDIPHLYHPVVVEPKEAVRALRGAIAEMDRRYKMFAQRGVRNIASFNSKLPEGEKPLPYLVIVVDELADLMMTAAAEFEKLICRLAQLARATGIHLIVATQRPSVNVLTGVIKANIPARIAFAVASQVDSRTILDAVGAERLIGSGDMLFDSSSGGKATRIQGAYLSEEEVNRVVDVVKEHYENDDTDFGEGLDLAAVEDDGVPGEESGNSYDEEKRDDLYDEIRQFVIRHDEMSASLIQRRFEIGYPRAGRIVDQLERDGVVGPADGPKPRKVLMGG